MTLVTLLVASIATFPLASASAAPDDPPTDTAPGDEPVVDSVPEETVPDDEQPSDTSTTTPTTEPAPTTAPVETTSTTTTTVVESTSPVTVATSTTTTVTPERGEQPADDPLIGPLSTSPGDSEIRQNNTFYAYVGAGENVDISFAKVGPVADASGVTITVTSPDGTALTCSNPAGAANGTGCSWPNLTSGTPGIWEITFTKTVPTALSTDLYDWTINVQSGATTIPGRVYSELYFMFQGVQPSDSTSVPLWYQSELGYQYSAVYTGYNGIDSTFTADATGVRYDGTCTSAYASVQNTDPDRSVAAPGECGDPYKIFFEPPAADLPASATLPDGTTEWLVPPIAPDPTITDVTFTPDSTTSRSGDIDFTVDNNFTGQVVVEIDTDNDGIFDVALPASAVDGLGSVAFDGLDAIGDPVPSYQDMAVRVSIEQIGEIHFKNFDVERRAGGLEVTRLNGPAAGDSTIYWNDSELSTTTTCGIQPVPLDGRAGIDSTGGAHRWDPSVSGCTNQLLGWGDGRYIDDWTFRSIDESLQILVEGEPPTPPLVVCSAEEIRATQRHWFFGDSGAIDFGVSGTTATAVLGGATTSEGSTVVTDTSGTLLFWSNGQVVYDQNGNPMPNGSDLLGEPGATQTVAAFPALGQPGIYYLVTTTTEVVLQPNGSLHYSVVDMSLNGGLGDVTTKNVPLGAANTASEALTAVPNADGSGFWVLTYTNNSPNVLAYEFGAGGPVGPAVTSVLPTDNGASLGSLYFSADLTQLVALSADQSVTPATAIVRLLDFDADTGQVTERMSWMLPEGPGTGNVGYTADFSPAGDYVYATKIGGGGQLYRYRITGATTGAEVKSTEESVGTTGAAGGHVRRGPDGRMYVASNGTTTLNVVNDPDNAVDPNYVQGGFALAPGAASLWGLPQMVTGCPPPLLLDFGDAPDSYSTTLADDGPRHTIVDYDGGTNTAPLMLGTSIGAEDDGQPSAAADGDGIDEEDGVSDEIVMVIGENTDVEVVVTNTSGEPATLAGWIDLDDDGVFEAGELQSVVVPSGGTTIQTLTFPSVGLPGDGTFARFRLFPAGTDPADVLPTGPAAAGEVEDYTVLGPIAILLDCPSVYALQGGSPQTIYQVDTTTGDMTVVGEFNAGFGTANGMGISADARYVFSHHNGEVLRYDTHTGLTDDFTGVGGLNATHGGVDPSSGIYYYGNIGSGAVYAFDPATESNLGQVATLNFDVVPAGNNGDWSFDSQGNMYVVAGSTATSSLYVVSGLPTTAQGTPVAVTGEQITAFSTSGAAVNGIAFDATGSLYAASNAVIFEINPSTGAILNTETLDPSGVSVDLASCATPATIVVQKDIVDRFVASDQFEVTVTGGGIVENNVGVTAGTDTGVQANPAENAGTVLGLPGETYDISEAGAAGADLANYVSEWVCVNNTDGGAVVADGTGATGSFTMPASIDGVGAAIECTFTNEPVLPVEFGDAPDSYGTTEAADGARHERPGGGGVQLGASVDTELDGQPSVAADGDDTTSVDDEDGVLFNTDVSVPGRLETVWVTASGSGFVNAWIDFDLDGVFDAGEQIAADAPVVAGDNQLTYTVPTGADFVAGDSYARFRISSAAGTANTPTGVAHDGEVEDYTRTLFDAPEVALNECPAGTIPIPVSIIQNPSFESRTGDFQNSSAASTIGFATNWFDSHPTGGQYHVFSPTFDSGPVESTMPVRAGADGYAFMGGHSMAGVGEGATNTLAEPLLPGATYVGFFSMAAGGYGRQGDGSMAFFGTSSQNVGHIPGTGVVTPTAANTENLFATPVVNHAGAGVRPTWELNTFNLVPTQAWDFLRVEVRNANPAADGTVAGQVWMNFDDFHMFLCEPQRDYGDAPDSYDTLLGSGGPYHDQPDYDPSTSTSSLMLGSSLDIEDDAAPTAGADGDDTTDVADEDGVTGPIVMEMGESTTVSVAVINTTGGDATLVGWIDLNGDGDFGDAGEMVSVPAPASGDYDLVFPAATTTDLTYARFRLFPGTVTDPQPTGPASAGEVEDYPVAIAAYEVVKTANPASGTDVGVGDDVTYTVTLTNVGTVPLTGIGFDDDLTDVLDDADLIAGPAVNPATAGTATIDAGVLSFTGDLGVGEIVTVFYAVDVLDPSDSAGDGVLENAVVGGNCPDPAITDPQDPNYDAECVTVHPVRDVSIVKSSVPADGSTVAPGETITYTVAITNTGGYEYTVGDPAEVTDDLSGVIDDALYNNNADDAGHPGTLDYSAPELTWTGPLAPDETVTITYTITVLSGENLGDAELENVVTGIDSNCVDPAITDPADPDHDPDCHNVLEVGAVQYRKTVDPPDPLSLQPGDTYTYTVTATNVGAVALTGLTFTDDLSGVLDDATFGPGPVTADVGTAAFDGVDQVTWNGDLAIGQVATVTYQVTIDNPPGGDSILINGVVGTGPGSNCPPPGPATDADCFKQIPQPLINTVKTSDQAGNVSPGDVVTYEFTVSNTGVGPAHAFEVVDDLSDVLDDAVYDGNVTLVTGPGSVTFDPVNQEVVWTGPLEVGEFATVTYSVTVNDATELGDGVLLNAVTSPDCFDPPVTNPDDFNFNPDCVTITPVEAWTAIKTSDAAGTVSPGGTVSYTIAIENTGGVDLTAADVVNVDDLTEVLDDASYDGNAADGVHPGTFDFTSPTLTWAGDLAIDEEVTLTYSVTINDATELGDGQLVNAITGSTNCPDPAITDPSHPDFDPDCVNVEDIEAWTAVKTSDAVGTVVPGATVNYTITVTNTGNVPLAAADVVVDDDLSNVLDDAVFDGNADDGVHPGTFDFTAPTLTWSGDLAVDEVVTLTYSVTVNDATALGDGQLVNAITGPPNCPDPAITDPAHADYDADCVPIIPIEAWTAIKSSDAVGPVLPGGVVDYTITITNTGNVPLTAADVVNVDDLTEVLDDASYDGNAADGVHPGTFDFTSPTLTWTGDLAVDEVVTLTYSVTINDDTELGDGELVNAITGSTNCPNPAITDPSHPDFDPDCVNIEDIEAWTAVKTSDAVGPVLPGGVVNYTITITNTGNVPVTAVNVDDLTEVLDDASYDGNADDGVHPGTFDLTSPTLTWTGDLAVDEVVTLTYSVTVDDATDLGDGELVNAITGSSSCPDPAITDATDPNFDSGCVTITPVEAWTAIKTSDAVGTVEPGGTVNYTITVENTGNVDLLAADVVVQDDLTEVLDDATFDGNVDQGATYAAPVITWSGDLAVDAVIVISYSVTVNDATELGDGELVNAITGPPNCPDPAITDPAHADYDADCVPIIPIEAWTAIKTSDAVGTVLPGGTVNYTITVTNTGNVPVTAVNVDDLTEVLDDASYDGNADDGVHPGNFDFTSPALTWTGDLAVDEVVTLTYSVTINDATELGDGELVNAITGSTNCPNPAITDPAHPDFDPECVNIEDVEAWTAVKTSDAAGNVLPGDTVDYTITVTNTGSVPLSAADVVNVDDLTQVLDDASFDGNADDDGHAGTFDFTAPALTWTGDLAVDEVVTLTYSVTINDATDIGDGELLNAITGSSNCPDPAITDPADPDFDLECVNIEEVAAYTVVKTSNAVDPVLPGDTVEYTVVVTNTGDVDLIGADAATFDDDLSGVLDDASFNNDESADVGTVSFSTPVISWSGDLAVDAVATITYSVTVDQPIGGDHQLVNAVVGGDCPDPAVTDPAAIDFDETCVVVDPLPGVHIVKAILGDPVEELQPGDTFEYVVTVENIGQVDLVGETFSDDLSDVLDDAELDQGSMTADVGVIDFTDPDLTWIGDLDIGQMATIRYSITIDDPMTGDAELLNGVVGSIYSNCVPPDASDPDCWESTPLPNVHVSKELVGPENPEPGDTVTYRITAENRGGAIAEDEEIVDDLAGVLDDAVYNGDATASLAGTLSYDEPLISWTGDIAAGDSLVITYTVTIASFEQLGDAELENTVTGGENCTDATTADECSTRHEVQTERLDITKQVNRTSVSLGDMVAYTVTVRNVGTVDFTATNPATAIDDLSDVLDDATWVGNATASAGNVSFSSPNLTWTGPLAVGDAVTLTYSVKVNATATGSGALYNTIGTSGESGSNCPVGSPTTECETLTQISLPPPPPARPGPITPTPIPVTG